MEVGPQTTQSHIIPLQQDNDSHSGAFIFEATNTNPVLHVAEGESESLEIQKRNYCPPPHTHTQICMSCALKVKQCGLDPAIHSFFLKLLLRCEAGEISAVCSKQIVSALISRRRLCFRLEVCGSYCCKPATITIVSESDSRCLSFI